MGYFFGSIIEQEKMFNIKYINRMIVSRKLTMLPELLKSNDWFLKTNFVDTVGIPDVIYKPLLLKYPKNITFNKELIRWSIDMGDY